MSDSIEAIVRRIVREEIERAASQASLSSRPEPERRRDRTPQRLNVFEVAQAARRHPVTVRLALESGVLHGTQSMKGGRWTIHEDCAVAWVNGEKCTHQASNVTRIKR